MAGGIDWFRWHHGSVSDLKFPLVAKRSGASVAEVIAVWACLLEAASMNADQRGVLSGLPDFDALDCALGMSDGRCEAIFRALQARGLIDEHLHIVAWSKRQPKREREDDNSTSRVQAFRERKRHETPSNASDGTETPRVEKSREESNTPPIPPTGGKPTARKSEAIGFQAWCALVKAGGQKLIPEDDPVFAYAERVGLPDDFLRLAWREFQDRYSDGTKPKRYRDWRAVFRNAVRGNWFKLWWHDGNGYALTTAGMQAAKAHQRTEAEAA